MSKSSPGSGRGGGAGAHDESPPLAFLLSALHQVECCGNSAVVAAV